MDDLLRTQTIIKSFEIEEDGPHVLLNFGPEGTFLITDIIITNEGTNTLIQVCDDVNKFNLVRLDSKEKKFSHTFEGGFMFWKGARLEILKKGEGRITIVVGYLKFPYGLQYDLWIAR